MPASSAYRRSSNLTAVDSSYLVHRERGVPAPEVEAYVAEIHEALELGDVEEAYACLRDWLAREARHAGAGRTSNLAEVMQTVLEMLAWTVERVPRTLSRRPALAVAA